jgi:hypothetical protein
MKESGEDHSTQTASHSLTRAWRFMDLLHNATARELTLVATTVAAVWLPPAVLSAFRGWDVFRSFITDCASQSRFLIILPVLMLAAPMVNVRLAMVVRQLKEFVPPDQLSRYQSGWNSFERLRNSGVVQVAIVLLTYAVVVWLGSYLDPRGVEVVSWWRGGSWGFGWFSAAGTWAAFVSYPILIYFTVIWLWRQAIWARFMLSMTHMDLRLIAAHPDCLGGIGFVGSALRGQRPFSFCMGAALAGAVANRIIHGGQKLTSFGPVAAVLAAAVLLVCVAPYSAFTPVLIQVRRRGILSYGSLARAAGEQFEKKWLPAAGRETENLLAVSDFEAINNLYGVVGNINDIGTIPVSRMDLYILLAVAFVPAIPVVLGSIPLETVARALVKMLI